MHDEEELEIDAVDLVGLQRGYDALLGAEGLALSGGDPHQRTPSNLHIHISRLLDDWRETVDDNLVPGVPSEMLLEILDEHFAQVDGLPTAGSPRSVEEIAMSLTIRLGDEDVPAHEVPAYVEEWLDVALNDLRRFIRAHWNDFDF